MYSKLQYISNGISVNEQLESIQKALDSGCSWIQLRFKNENEVEKLAEKVKILCSSYQATFIVNDFVHVAKNVEADGLHLGLEDESVASAREILGENKIIGGSTNTFEDVLKRIEEKCDYIGLGPFRFTQTKDRLSPVLGLGKYAFIQQELEKRDLSIPIYAIGGIQLEDIQSILETGVYGIAVSGLVGGSKNPNELVKQIKHLMYVKS